MTQPKDHGCRRVLVKIMKIAIPTAITVGLCYVLFTGVDFGAMMEVIRHDCNFWWIGLGLAISILSHVVRAMRWQIQLNALDIFPPLGWIVLSIFGTYAVNLVFPRLGEIWRTGYIATRQKAPFTTVLGSMVADRLADTITVLTISLITFLAAAPALMSFLTRYPEVYQGIMHLATSPWIWSSLVVLAIALWWFLSMRTTNPLVLKVRKAIKELWQGFAVIVRMKGRVRWMLLTLALWGCYFTQLYVAFFAFPFTAEIIHSHGIVAVLVCFCLSSIAMGIPSNGGIGPWQIA
ncbi:MAG: flippase-like domain-containing protein [Muribaculaceae bacterium]|nr:flippase-like domain-containing protein [Muribaculaceae bacterium]